jgi:hypothetical protein
MFGAVQSQLVPNQYPTVINTPLDRAYLRPLQQPLFDTEVIAAASCTQVTFFQKPQSNSTQYGSITKSEGDTNMTQSAMLDYPREHSVLGFTLAIDPCQGLETVSLIYRRAYFQFILSGSRKYLEIPLDRIPHGLGLEGAVASTQSADTTHSGIISQFKNGMGHIGNFYKFNLGRAALKIKAGEAFKTVLNWSYAPSLPTTLNSNMGKTLDISGIGGGSNAGYAVVRSYIVGINWASI